MIYEEIILKKTQAKMTCYRMDQSDELKISQRPAIVICPGGGYAMRSAREAEPVAIKLLSLGFQVFILQYSVAPAVFPTALRELAESVQTIRQFQQAWQIMPDKILVAGFSAGGHLAASLGVYWHEAVLSDFLSGEPEAWQPNGLVLSYPVITAGKFTHEGSLQNITPTNAARVSLEEKVSEQTPPTFLWHTAADQAVPVENSLLFATALSRHQVPFELHVFPRGKHGLSLATRETEGHSGKTIEPAAAQWIDLFAVWFAEQFVY